MPSAHTPQTENPASPWRRFRRWRKERPFWGGLLLVLSGVELFLSSNQDLGALQVHVGPTGFLSYVIPAMLVLCGAGTVMAPSLRLFYGIVGSLVAVYSLIGLNLGGFLLGLLLGIIGGALTIAWTPLTATTPTTVSPAADDEPVAEPVNDSPAPALAMEQDTEPQPRYDHGQPYGSASTSGQSYGDTAEIPRQVQNPERWWGDSETEPRHREEEPPPYGTSSGGSHTRILAITLVPVTLAAALVTVVHGSTPAYAAPCPTPRIAASASAKAAPSKAGQSPAPQRSQAPAPQNGQAPAPGNAASSAAQAAPSTSPASGSSSGTDKSSGNPLVDAWNGFVGGIKKFFGAGSDATPAGPAPSASPSSSRSTSPSASSSAGGAPTLPVPPGATPGRAQASASASTSPCQLTAKAAAPGQPPVSVVPGTITSAEQVMEDFKFEGVVDLPTKNGTVRALKFTMSKATTTPFQLRVPEPSGKTTQITSSQLTIKSDPNKSDANKVEFYTYKFTGTLTRVKLPLIPITIPSQLLDLLKPLTTLMLTPDSPALLLQLLSLTAFPEMSFKDVTLDLAFVHSDILTADNLRIAEV